MIRNGNPAAKAPIYLIGARGSGKTTVGRQLAALLETPFHDLDEVLRQSEHKSVAEIVAANGWPEFRRLESHYLKQTSDKCLSGGVIATGGGVVLAAENRKFMQSRGHVIWLDANIEILEKRLRANPLAAQRPALTELSASDEIRRIVSERKSLYESCAHKIIDGSQAPEEVCKIIHAWLCDVD